MALASTEEPGLGPTTVAKRSGESRCSAVHARTGSLDTSHPSQLRLLKGHNVTDLLALRKRAAFGAPELAPPHCPWTRG